MAKYVIEESTLTNIANSIRRKTGSTDDIKTNEMATTLDLIPNRSDDGVVVNSGNVTVFAGNYVADVHKTIDSVPVTTPIIEVTPDGVIKATVIQPEGYVFEDTGESTEQLPVAEGAIITPSAEEQVAIMSGTYAIGDITVEGDPNLIPENIVQGVSIFGVEGNYSGNTHDAVSINVYSRFQYYIDVFYQSASSNMFIRDTIQTSGVGQIFDDVARGSTFYIAFTLNTTNATINIEHTDLVQVDSDSEMTRTLSFTADNGYIKLNFYTSGVGGEEII